MSRFADDIRRIAKQSKLKGGLAEQSARDAIGSRTVSIIGDPYSAMPSPTAEDNPPPAPYGVPIAPDEITGLTAWYDASDAATITKSGADVSGWDDKSGNGNNLTNTGGFPQFITGGVSSVFPNDCIRFSNYAYLTRTADAADYVGIHTHYAVALIQSRGISGANETRSIFNLYKSATNGEMGFRIQHISANSYLHAIHGEESHVTSALSYTDTINQQLVESYCTGTVLGAVQNGVSQGTSPYTTTYPVNFTGGKVELGLTWSALYELNILELVVYNVVPSASDLAGLRNYFIAKRGQYGS